MGGADEGLGRRSRTQPKVVWEGRREEERYVRKISWVAVEEQILDAKGRKGVNISLLPEFSKNQPIYTQLTSGNCLVSILNLILNG